MKYLMITLLLISAYSFAEDNTNSESDTIQPPKVCAVPNFRLNYRKINISKILSERSCKKGDILWIYAQTPDYSAYVAARACVIDTIKFSVTQVICEYSGIVREYTETKEK